MKILQTSGTRKHAVARATIRPGKGTVRINKVPLQHVGPRFINLKIQEPLLLVGDVAKKVDIDINVNGGGITGQAEASRIAIGRALVAFSGNDEVKKKLLEYDRLILVADVRRKEKTKPNNNGKARAKRQKSYR